MFFDGDLQSGIGAAVQQSKAVLCFVYDDGETSSQWEDALTGDELSAAVTAQAVALRIEAGSQEAGFLAPICHIGSTPAVIVIKNAQLQLNLQSADTSPADLRARLLAAFDEASAVDVPAAAAAPRSPSPQAPSPPSQSHPDEPSSSPAPPSEPESSPAPAPAASSAPKSKQAEVKGYLSFPPPPPGAMRLPNNAYDALNQHTTELASQGQSDSEILQKQLACLSNIPILKEEVAKLRETEHPTLSDDVRARLLRMPPVILRIGKPTAAVAAFGSSPSSSRPRTPAQSTTTPPPPATRPESDPAPPRRPQPQPKPEASTKAPAEGAPVGSSSSSQSSANQQRLEYIRAQRAREDAARAERERIKNQIKADREERRRLDELRKQNDRANASDSNDNASDTPSGMGSGRNAVRVQARTFDGSTLRTTLPGTATLAEDVRPWLDASSNPAVPYNLKLILTPLPNRTIEAGEEGQSLRDLGIRGSCTFVMVPVRGYVDSYAGGGSGATGMISSVVSGGYGLVSGVAGGLWGVGRRALGYDAPGPAEGQGGEATQSSSSSGPQTVGGAAESTSGGAASARVRTLADQRAEAARRDQQFYNGNALNFQPKRDDEAKKD